MRFDFLKKYSSGVKKAIKVYKEKEMMWRYTEVSLTLFTIAFFVIFAIRPAVATISGLIGEIKDREGLTVKMRGKINAIIAAQEEYSLYQEKVAAVDSFLPTDYKVAQGTAQVIGSAEDSQVFVEGISFSELPIIGKSKTKSKTKSQTPLANVGFNFSASGGYFNLKEFIGRVLNARRWLEISGYQIGKSKERGESSGGEQLKLAVDGKLYCWRDEK